MSLYATAFQFKQAPTGIDVSTIDQSNVGNQAAQDLALTNILKRASGWVNSILRVDSIEASLKTETKEVRLNKDGRLSVHVDEVPIKSLQSVQFRYSTLEQWMNVDLNTIQAFDNWFTIYELYNTTMISNQFYYFFPSIYESHNLTEIPLTVQYSYVSGYANTQLSVDATIGATSVTVADATGIVVGKQLTIYDGIEEETVTVDSISGNVLTLKNSLVFAHTSGTVINEIPEDIQQATILLAGVLIKERGSVAITMQESTISTLANSGQKIDDIAIAKELLSRYRRMVTD